MSDNYINQFLEELDHTLPPIIPRTQVKKLIGFFESSYLAVLDSEGKGPKGAIRCGRHVGYLKKPFLEWLRERMTTPEERRGIAVPSKKDPANALLESLYEFSAKS